MVRPSGQRHLSSAGPSATRCSNISWSTRRCRQCARLKEFHRDGTANLFMMFAPLEGWRHVKVTDRHTAVDYAHVLKDLADIHYANAKTIAISSKSISPLGRERQRFARFRATG